MNLTESQRAAMRRNSLFEQLAQRRLAGMAEDLVLVRGAAIPLSRELQATIDRLLRQIEAGVIAAVDLKVGAGRFLEGVDRRAMEEIDAALATREQAWYSAEAAHAVAILALGDDLDALRVYDVKPGWPA